LFCPPPHPLPKKEKEKKRKVSVAELAIIPKDNYRNSGYKQEINFLFYKKSLFYIVFYPTITYYKNMEIKFLF
jgi:hypothetical protein